MVWLFKERVRAFWIDKIEAWNSILLENPTMACTRPWITSHESPSSAESSSFGPIGCLKAYWLLDLMNCIKGCWRAGPQIIMQSSPELNPKSRRKGQICWPMHVMVLNLVHQVFAGWDSTKALTIWGQSCIMSQIWQIYLCKFFAGLG